eukprot:s530_g18.t1
MARLGGLLLLVAGALLGSHVSTLLFANVPTQSLRSRTAARAVDERDEGLVLIKPEETGKVVKRDKFNNPPRVVFKTNDWDQPEIQYSTGASNQVNYITPVVQLSLNVNFFSFIGLFTVGGIIEIQRFFPDTLYWPGVTPVSIPEGDPQKWTSQDDCVEELWEAETLAKEAWWPSGKGSWPGITVKVNPRTILNISQDPKVSSCSCEEPEEPEELEEEEEEEVGEAEAEMEEERRIYAAPVPLPNLMDNVLLLEATIPLRTSGKNIFRMFPPETWLDITGNNTALGTRCLFASRRHENSVLGTVEKFLQIPSAAKEEQLPIIAPQSVITQMGDKEQQAWILQIHPGDELLRVIVRPGCESQENRLVKDPATGQPPNFTSHPLRPEQLRSLGWMLNQERPEKEAFVTELRDFEVCPDAAHWRLEGSLRCEYLGVRGGVLGDAIGYGKTACTIGLIDKTKALPMPRVPMPYRGFVPSRATLVLAPSNLHGQWLSEIKKFTRDTLKVLSVPTCAQLKRLFYSSAYLTRLEELTRENSLGFTFPQTGGRKHPGSEWGKAYRHAFEALPHWCAKRLGFFLECDRKRRRLNGKQRSQDFLQEDPSAILEQTSFVPLEAFWWRRVVCDEFHELLGRYPPAQVAVELFHADFKWGLSGTPPCQTLPQAAGFMGVQLPEGDRDEERKEWIDAFVRRNTADLPPLEEEVPGELPAGCRRADSDRAADAKGEMSVERALYMALTKTSQEVTLTQGSQGALEQQDEECQRQLALRRKELNSAQRDVKALADKALASVQLIQHFEPFFARRDLDGNGSEIHGVDLVSSLEKHCEHLQKASLQARAKFLGLKDPHKDKARLLSQLLCAAEKYSSHTRAKVLNRFFDSKGCGRPAKDADLKTGQAEAAWRQLMALAEDGDQGEESQDTIECIGTSSVRQAIRDAMAACGLVDSEAHSASPLLVHIVVSHGPTRWFAAADRRCIAWQPRFHAAFCQCPHSEPSQPNRGQGSGRASWHRKRSGSKGRNGPPGRGATLLCNLSSLTRSPLLSAGARYGGTRRDLKGHETYPFRFYPGCRGAMTARPLTCESGRSTASSTSDSRKFHEGQLWDTSATDRWIEQAAESSLPPQAAKARPFSARSIRGQLQRSDSQSGAQEEAHHLFVAVQLFDC